MDSKLCLLDELEPYQGRGAIIDGEQVALFYIPESEQGVLAIQNWDPIGGAYVLCRGIVGDIGGRICVASPLYKQHFDLITGQCIENQDVILKTWSIKIHRGQVLTEVNEAVAV